MSVIRLRTEVARRVQEHLFTEPGEHFGFLMAQAAEGPEGPIFLVENFHPIPDEQVRLSESGWEVSTEALLEAINAAVRTERALVEVHNHPGGWSSFSPIDREGFEEFVPYVLDSLPERPYAATVWTKEGVYGEYFPQDGEPGAVRSITEVGHNLTQHAAGPPSEDPAPRFDRQEPWFTRAGQRQLAQLRIAVAGLGGTGSQVVQNLAYLGIRDFLLIDHDAADQTNLNRLVTASHGDVETPKTILARRRIRSVASEARVQTFEKKIQSRAALDALKTADVAFGCVDNDGARLVLNELCLAYLNPLIDLGVGIEADEGDVREAGGRVAVVIPGGPCLHCMGEIDTDEARYFLSDSSDQALAAELGYVEGVDEPAPAVVSLNAAVAASAVNEFALFTSGVRRPTPFTELDVLGTAYETVSQRLSPREVEKKDGCVQCSVLGSGDRARIERYAKGIPRLESDDERKAG